MHSASSHDRGPLSGRPVPRLTPELAARFWAKVDKTDTCWLWTASVHEGGYGQFAAYGSVWRAHRIAYAAVVGPIPATLTLDHLCRNKRCVNPAHLEPVTIAENRRRAPLKERCKNGHLFDDENTYIRKDTGTRMCKQCRREAYRRWYYATKFSASRRAAAAVYIVLITALSAALFAARADAATPFGISDDGAMLAGGGIEWAARHGVHDIRFQVRPGQLERYDQAIWDTDAHGMRIIVSPLGKPDSFPEFAGRIAARWPQIDAISDYNEPEINGFRDDPCGYIRLHNQTREAVRQIRKSLPVLFGEFSPHSTFPYLKQMAACAENPRGLTNISFHPYQWSTDPLSPKQLDSQDHSGGWWGIGRLPRMMRWMARKSTLRAFGIRKAPRLWITEFAYLTDYASSEEIHRWWPRAIRQADRLNAKTIIAQGAVTSGEGRKWESALPNGLISSLAMAGS